jgi:hypothetical protein
VLLPRPNVNSAHGLDALFGPIPVGLTGSR